MVITGVADHVPQPIRRLVYWNAFVPKDSECLNDLVPPLYVGLFDPAAAEQGNGSVMLPFPIWREAFINDGDLETARRAFSLLNPHPLNTFLEDFAQGPSGDDADFEVVCELHRGYGDAALASLASKAVGEGPGPRQSRALLYRSRAAGSGVGGGRKKPRLRRQRSSDSVGRLTFDRFFNAEQSISRISTPRPLVLSSLPWRSTASRFCFLGG